MVGEATSYLESSRLAGDISLNTDRPHIIYTAFSSDFAMRDEVERASRCNGSMSLTRTQKSPARHHQIRFPSGWTIVKIWCVD